MKSSIDWVSLGEALFFVLALGLVVAVICFVGAAIWAARNRRIMWERYEQERAERFPPRKEWPRK